MSAMRLLNDELKRQVSNIYNKRLKEARFPSLKAIICRCLIEKNNLLSIGHGVSQTHLPIYCFLEKLALDQSTGHKTAFIKWMIEADRSYSMTIDYLISKNVTVHWNANSAVQLLYKSKSTSRHEVMKGFFYQQTNKGESP
jgi:hypothetical protein